MTLRIAPTAWLIDAASGTVLAGDALTARVAEAKKAAENGAGLVVLAIRRKLDPVVAYLGCLAAGRAVVLVDPAATEACAAIVERFAPSLVVGAVGSVPPGYVGDMHLNLPCWRRIAPPAPEPHRDLSLLLPTSGSSGSPKLVRLSGRAVAANAESIAAGLGIRPTDVTMTTLPLFYTFGLSVLHSHLVAGAGVVIGDRSMVQRPFWSDVSRFKVTSLAAVPYLFDLLARHNFDPGLYPSLRTLTQAGGRMRPDVIEDFRARMEVVGGKLFVMYGQTEATARITILPPELLADKLGSVGLVVAGGSVRIEDDEVVYEGPNVMMGYAEDAEDLTKGDELRGVLRTGDLGWVDDDGFLWIKGRTKRIAKVFGERVNLDDAEALCGGLAPVAAVAGDDLLIVFVESQEAGLAATVRRAVADGIRVHYTGVDVWLIDALPRLASGKVDYPALPV